MGRKDILLDGMHRGDGGSVAMSAGKESYQARSDNVHIAGTQYTVRVCRHLNLEIGNGFCADYAQSNYFEQFEIGKSRCNVVEILNMRSDGCR